jgi:hypothetical protein
MSDQRFWSIERAAGFFLVLGFVANFAGVLMFTIRGGAGGGAQPSHTFFVWERGFFMAAVILTAIGFVLLEGPPTIPMGAFWHNRARPRTCSQGSCW